jgi:phosphatidylserine/phosphatidylglycerophosphate/cardiolipin synthase-like enzyme
MTKTYLHPFMTLKYAKIIYHKPMESFFKYYFTIAASIDEILIISPYISPLEGSGRTIKKFCDNARKNNTKIILITKTPEFSYQHNAIEEFSQFSNVEIRYNKNLHAKLYVCNSNFPELSFAMIGSANFTAHSITNNIEIALLIHNKGEGKQIVHELYNWGSFKLRISDESKLVKKFGMVLK